MNFIDPTADELACLRPDPLIFEQELDTRVEVATSLERAFGYRAGRSYWRSDAGHLYAVELGDFGRGWPSMAIIYAFWDRYEPRPVDDVAIDQALEPFLHWVADACEGLDAADFDWTLARTPRKRAQPFK